jgi:hypothetical protein
MQIAGMIGSSNQAVSEVKSSAGTKAQGETSNTSFLSSVKEVAESMTGKIVAANASKAGQLDIRKDDFEIENEMPEKLDTVYDFIADIRQIMRDAKKKRQV